MSAETTLTSGKPMSIILKFVIPLFVGNVFQQLYNMVDTIIVGHYVEQKHLRLLVLPVPLISLLWDLLLE